MKKYDKGRKTVSFRLLKQQNQHSYLYHGKKIQQLILF
jgi:hypothetical protein